MGTSYADEMKRQEMRRARLSYLLALLPEEMRRDPTVAAVANHLAGQDGFSVEGCLVEMVRALVKSGDELRKAYIDADAQRGFPRMLVAVPNSVIG